MKELLIEILSWLTVCGGWLCALIILLMWAEKRKKLKWAKKWAETCANQAKANATAVQKKQAELASAQKQIKRLERDLAKRL